MALKVGELFATLNLDNSGFNSSLNSAKNSALSAVGNIVKTLGALKLGKDIIDSYVNFESAFAGVQKTVDETANTSYADLEASIRSMSKELPAAATEIASVAEAAGQLGIGADDIESFTRVMIDLGESTNLSSEDAATTLARLANIMGTSSSEYSNLGSAIVDLGNNFATTESEIAAMALRIAGAGAQIGMSEADVLGFSAAFSSVGIEADAGGSAFSTFAANLNLAVSKGGKDLKKYAKVAGMSGEEFKQAFEQDATGAILTFIDGLGKSEDGIKVLNELGITEIRQRDALLRAAGASDTFIEAIEKSNEAYAENIALTKEAQKRYATTASKIAMLKNRIKDLGISLGKMMAPALNTLIDGAIGLLDWVTDTDSSLEEKISDLISNIPGYIESGIKSIGPKIASIDWTSIFSSLANSGASIINSLANSITAASTGTDVVFSAFRNIIAAALTPANITKIMSAIKNLGMSILSALARSVTSAASNTALLVGSVSNYIKSALSEENLALTIGSLEGTGKAIIDLIVASISSLAGAGSSIAASLGDLISTVNWEDVGTQIGTLASGLIDHLVTAIGNTDFTAVMGAIGSALGAAVVGLYNAAKGIAASLASYMLDKDTWVKFGNAILAIFEGILSGIKSFVDSFLDKFNPFTGSVGNKISQSVTVTPEFVPEEPTISEDTVESLVTDAIEGAKAEIEVPVEISSIQAATLGAEAKTELGSAGTEAGELLNKNLSTAIANTEGVSNAITNLVNSVKIDLSVLETEANTIGRNFSYGLAQGIRDGRSSVISAAIEVARAAASAANDELDINSPSRVMMKSGGFFDQGFAKGILKDMPTVYRASSQMARMAADAASIRNPSGRWSNFGSAANQSGASAAQTDLPPIRLTTYLNGRDVSEAMSDDTAYTQNDRSGRISARYGTVL